MPGDFFSVFVWCVISRNSVSVIVLFWEENSVALGEKAQVVLLDASTCLQEVLSVRVVSEFFVFSDGLSSHRKEGEGREKKV